MPRSPPDNDELADLLERVADLLEAQEANAWRVRAYRAAATAIRVRDRPLADVYAEEGTAGLLELPGVGRSLASALTEYLTTGRLALLDRLEGEVGPEDLFTTLPGLGADLARRIHETLGVESLEELERAAYDGRLDQVAGFGPRRVQAVRDALTAVLSRSARRRARRHEVVGHDLPAEPPVGLLLDVDRIYRERAAAGTLRKIAPRRFNPEKVAWLPILHADRGGYALTALFSNTARAHELGTTNDWVVLYAEKDGTEARCTVVTESRGALAGRRVIRGREGECARFYETRPA